MLVRQVQRVEFPRSRVPHGPNTNQHLAARRTLFRNYGAPPRAHLERSDTGSPPRARPESGAVSSSIHMRLNCGAGPESRHVSRIGPYHRFAKKGLTRRCSGLTAFAAELHFVRPRPERARQALRDCASSLSMQFTSHFEVVRHATPSWLPAIDSAPPRHFLSRAPRLLPPVPTVPALVVVL